MSAGDEPTTLGQSLHGVIECNQIFASIGANHRRVIQRDILEARAAFQVVTPRMLYQNAPHQLRRNREKMGAILPVHALIIHQAQVGFVDQCRGLETVAVALTLHVATRQAVELVINDGGQPFERSLVSVAPGAEKRAYIGFSRLPRLCRPLHRLWDEL